jgi:2-dehydro-3-deoxygluconokinase
MANILCFGEIMLRLKAPGQERFFQSPLLEASFGGGEANVAVSLSCFGMDAEYVTVLPDNVLGDACVRELRRFGVSTGKILRGRGRMGLYYFEGGANQLPSRVIYDREHSAIALAKPGDLDWEQILGGASWLHITGITPAISQSAGDLTLESVKAARAAGIPISCDLNYRKNLWNYGKQAAELMPELVKYVDVLIAGRDDCREALGIALDAGAGGDDGSDAGDDLDIDRYKTLSQTVLDRYPEMKMAAITLRESRSADSNGWSGCLNDRRDFYVSRHYDINDIVERVGGGDAFAAGLIYGLNKYTSRQEALEFAVAAGCLKHSIIGDFNQVSARDVEALMGGDATGRVRR